MYIIQRGVRQGPVPVHQRTLLPPPAAEGHDAIPDTAREDGLEAIGCAESTPTGTASSSVQHLYAGSRHQGGQWQH